MCKECQYIRHCKTRGCQVANYEIHQNVYQPIKVNCEMTKGDVYKRQAGDGMGEQVAAGFPWGISSVGRAPALQAGGHEFESRILHLILLM